MHMKKRKEPKRLLGEKMQIRKRVIPVLCRASRRYDRPLRAVELPLAEKDRRHGGVTPPPRSEADWSTAPKDAIGFHR